MILPNDLNSVHLIFVNQGDSLISKIPLRIIFMLITETYPSTNSLKMVVEIDHHIVL